MGQYCVYWSVNFWLLILFIFKCGTTGWQIQTANLGLWEQRRWVIRGTILVSLPLRVYFFLPWTTLIRSITTEWLWLHGGLKTTDNVWPTSVCGAHTNLITHSYYGPSSSHTRPFPQGKSPAGKQKDARGMFMHSALLILGRLITDVLAGEFSKQAITDFYRVGLHCCEVI